MASEIFKLRYEWLGRVGDLDCYVYPGTDVLHIRNTRGYERASLTRKWAAKVWPALKTFATSGIAIQRKCIESNIVGKLNKIKITERGWPLVLMNRRDAERVWQIVRVFARSGKLT